jgi:hypothetical protein
VCFLAFQNTDELLLVIQLLLVIKLWHMCAGMQIQIYRRYRYIKYSSLPSSRHYYALGFSMPPPLSISRAPAQTSASTLPTTVTQLLSRCYATATALQRSCYGTCADPAVHSSQLLPLQPALWQPQVAEAVMQCTAGSAEVPALLLPSSVSLGARHTRQNVGRQGLPAATARAEDTAAEDEALLRMSRVFGFRVCGLAVSAAVVATRLQLPCCYSSTRFKAMSTIESLYFQNDR